MADLELSVFPLITKNIMSRTREEIAGVTLLGEKKTVYPTDYAPQMLETFVNKHPENDYLVGSSVPRHHRCTEGASEHWLRSGSYQGQRRQAEGSRHISGLHHPACERRGHQDHRRSAGSCEDGINFEGARTLHPGYHTYR